MLSTSKCSSAYAHHLNTLRTLLNTGIVIALVLLMGGRAFAGDTSLTWDSNTDPQITGYMLYYGQSSGSYATKVDAGKVNSYTLTGLIEGKTYYFAVTAYNTSHTESEYSNEASRLIPYAAPAASFTTASTSGTAPLAIAFTSTSAGTITGYLWNFGDGSNSTLANPTHSYAAGGFYSVALTVTGPGGSNTQTKANLITVTAPAPAPAPAPSPNPTAPTVGAAPATRPGLIAAYSFDEGSGSTLSDRSGNNNTGTISGATWISGRFGKALSFNGSNSQVTINDSPSLDLTSGMTLEAWVYPIATLSGWRTIVLKEQLSQSCYYLYANSDSNRPANGVFTTVENSLYGNGQLPANTWTHLAATYDGSMQRFYINGVQVSSRAQTGAIRTSGNPLRIGGNSIWGEYFQGTIDEVRIYNRALSADEIQSDMNISIDPPATSTSTSGLIAAYAFDEGSGSAVTDKSGSNNNGTIIGATWVTGRFGKALSFNGSNSLVSINSAASLNLSSGMTLEAWIFPTAVMSSGRTILFKERSSGAVYSIYANSSQNQPTEAVFTDAIHILYGGTQLPVNAWTHLAATYDGSMQRLYVNGVQVASRAQTGSIQASSGALRIGGNSLWGEYFQGTIDEVRIYNRALSVSEIQSDMNKSIGGVP